jgi:hypothetical protein
VIRVLAGASAVAIAVLLPAGSGAAAVPGSDAELHGDGGSATLEVGIGIAHDGRLIDAQAAAGGSRRPLVRYEWIAADNESTLGLEHLCPLPDDPIGGWVHRLVGYARGSGAVVSEEIVCVPRDPAATVAPSPPAAPGAPTIEEIWRAVALPAPQVATDPATRGITGLETRLWIDTAPTATVSATLDGYTITGTATIVVYRVDPGDAPPVTAAHPGTPDTPALRHTYETKGTYTLTATTTWRAEATMTGPGIDVPQPVDLGVASLTTTRTYRVNEVIARLTR